MKTQHKEISKSLPDLQLCAAGTKGSYDILSQASRALPDAELKALEEELSFYERTGLVGIHMSKLLLLLRLGALATAAQDKCLALKATGDVASQSPKKTQAAA